MYRSEAYVIAPQLSFERQAFDGAHDAEGYQSRSGVQTVLEAPEGWKRLRGELQQAGQVAVLASPPSYMKRHGLYTLPYRRRLIAKLKRLQPSLAFRDVRTELAGMRSIKQPEELQALQRAIDITIDTLNDTAARLADYTHEYQIEAAISHGFRSRGAAGHAFDPIVASGARTTTLHYMDNNDPITKGDLILIDAGAEVEEYSADLARTISQQPITGRKAEVWQAVAAVQDYAFSLIKPGAIPLDYETAVETFMGEQLRRLGVIKTNKREDIRHYFPSATSHFLGLDTHDAGDYRQPWRANMVITCEPGIYIPEEGIGVRIEDDVLITPEGYKVLSAACPRALSPVQ